MNKSNKDKQPDYWDMLFSLSATNIYSESHLLSLKPKQIENLYREKVGIDAKIRRD